MEQLWQLEGSAGGQVCAKQEQKQGDMVAALVRFCSVPICAQSILTIPKNLALHLQSMTITMAP